MEKKTHFKYITVIVILTCWTLNMTYNSLYSKDIIPKYGSAMKINGVLGLDYKYTKSSSSIKRKRKRKKKFIFPNIFKLVKTVNCDKLFQGKKSHISRAISKSNSTLPKELMPSDYISMTMNCSSFIQNRGYITDSLSKEETDFPIAYSILMYKDIFQAERLLRAIYRPQNYYCIHIDKKSPLILKLAMTSIAKCFENVFVASVLESVEWGYFSVVQAELNCMKDLLKFKKWKYFINLTGQEFTLRTNLEIVKILKIYNGANDARGSVKRLNQYKERLKYAGDPPHGLIPMKGPDHIVVNREFVRYLFCNKTAMDIIEWSKYVLIPDETLSSSLNNNPHLGIKGSYTGKKEEKATSRYKIWSSSSSPCNGKYVRYICILGTGDLPILYRAKALFVNKIYWNYHHYVLDCLEENIWTRTRDQYNGNITFNDTFYRSLDFVRNHL